MTELAGTRDKKRLLSEKVSKIASLEDLRLRDIEATLYDPAPTQPLTPKISVVPKLAKLGYYALYDLVYSVTAKDAKDNETVRAELTFNLVFSLNREREIAQEELEAFGAIGAVEIAHPYVRELIHNLTFRMNLPPFVLDVAPPVAA